MSFFGVRGRIAILVIIPLLLVVHVLDQRVSDAGDRLAAADADVAAAKAEVAVSAVLHELQKERGMSAVFLGKGAAEDRERLLGQRVLVDESFETAKRVVSDSGDSIGSADDAWDDLEREMGTGLVDLRAAVLARKIDGPESSKQFTVRTNALLEVSARIAQAPSSRVLARHFAAWHALLETGERSGRERAALSIALGKGGFAPGKLNALIATDAEEVTWRAEFERHATKSQRSTLESALASPKVEQAGQILANALAGGPLRPALVPIWFEAQTARVDAVHGTQEVIRDDAMKVAAAADAAAKRDRQSAYSVGVTSVIVMLLLALLVASTIVIPVRRIARTAEALSRGDVDGDLVRASAARVVRGQHELAQTERAVAATARYQGDVARDARALAAGSVDVQPTLASPDDVLGAAMVELADSTRTVVGLAEAVAAGDLSVDVRPRSAQDALAQSLSEMVAGLRVSADVARRVANGEVDVDVAPRSERDELGTALAEMVRELRGIVDITRAISSGDLNATPTPRSERDQLNLAVAAMANSLRSVIGELADASTSVGRGVASVASSSEEVSTAMHETSAALADLAGAIDSVQRESSLGADQGTALAEILGGAREVARSGRDDVARASTMVAGIEAGARELDETMLRLDERAASISAFVDTIEQIADQTNLLALNAAIEAARAGDAGRGFAVVANEVRSLAENARAASSSIATVVGEVRTETTSSVESARRNLEAATSCLECVDSAAASFGDVVDAVDDSAVRAGELARAAEGALERVEQASANVEEISASTEETTATMAELAETAASLRATSEQLQAVASGFELDRLDETDADAFARRRAA